MTTAASISGYQVLWCDQLIGEICSIMNAVSASCAMSARARISGTSRTAVTSTISRVNATCTTDRAVAVRWCCRPAWVSVPIIDTLSK